jgi:subtilisin family serine protease
MVGPIPAASTLAADKAANVVSPGYIRLSGTSFAAPVVAAAAAQILAQHPFWTPDQVKGALMLTARPLPLDTLNAGGVGEINAARAARVWSPPNPNAGLDRYVRFDGTGSLAFDSVSWLDAAHANVAWNDVAWNDVSWSSAAWSAVAWSDVAWNDVAWNDVAWNDVAWNDGAAGE